MFQADFESVPVRITLNQTTEIGTVFKTIFNVEIVFEVIAVAICGIVWAAAGFPHFTEVAWVFLGLACAGVYIGIIWNKE